MELNRFKTVKDLQPGQKLKPVVKTGVNEAIRNLIRERIKQNLKGGNIYPYLEMLSKMHNIKLSELEREYNIIKKGLK